ncbi:unnamed protein product [Rotaria sp. Silwood1]|nr:unnamed protein product [Rotaria sp. Silwood1]CAF1635592.1 unnamed protein product [Rotaria sp. Silwood1]
MTNLSSVISASSSPFLCTTVRIPPSRVKLLSHYNYQSRTASTNEKSLSTSLSSLLPASQSTTFRSNESSLTSPFKWGVPKQKRKRKATERDSIDEYFEAKYQAIESTSSSTKPPIKYTLRPRNCPQFNSTQQISSKLLPIGLFKIDVEDYETVKKVTPNEIISSIIQERKLIINDERFSIKFT